MNIKNLIASKIKLDNFSQEEIENMIVFPPQKAMGDFSLPCFSLSKTFRKSPQEIGERLKENLKDLSLFEKVEVTNGYLNFFLNKSFFTEKILEEALSNLEDFGKENIGKGKLALLEFSSINVAKNPHVGHLCCTVYGESFSRLFENFGYEVKRLNYLGDYGTQFGKMIAGFLKFGDKKKVEERGVDELQDIYIKANKLCEEDENFLEEARQTFLKLEQGDQKIKALYDWFKEISINEAKKIYEQLNITFDDYRGEAYYAQFNDETLKLLEKKKLVTKDQGALLVDLEEFNLGKLLVKQSNGASLYATRDLSSLLKRYEYYKPKRMVYVTAVQQELYFKQIFKIGELLGLPYMNDVSHISYGMLSLPEGKISSRKGAVGLIRDFFEVSTKKAEEVLKEKGTESEDLDKLKQEIGIGALVFSILRTTTSKDSVFDLKTAISFEGETGPYLQYTFARATSILKRFKETNKKLNLKLLDESSWEIVKLVQKFPSVLKLAFEEYEPSHIARFALSLASEFNKYYSENKILTENEEETLSKVKLTKVVQKILGKCLNFLVMSAPEKM